MTTESDKRPPTLRECLDACLGNQDFMREYRRLHGHALGLDTRSALERMVDEATGHPLAVSETEARQVSLLRSTPARRRARISRMTAPRGRRPSVTALTIPSSYAASDDAATSPLRTRFTPRRTSP